MFGTIRKHQTWLWLVIITLTIISFVIFFSPYSKMNTTRGTADYGSINGQRVTELKYLEARSELDLHTYFMTGHWLNEDQKRPEQDKMRETYNWLLLVQKQEALGIHPADDVLANLARQLVRPYERMGVTSPKVFVEKVLPPRGYRWTDFERYVRHFAGIQELIMTAGLGGKLVTPKEAGSFYEREHEEVPTAAVFFFASNYISGVPVPPVALEQFYSNRLANYRIPERVRVNYVLFGVSNFLAQAETELKTNLTEMVEANYEKLGTNAAMIFPDAKTPEAVKTKIREELLRRQAQEHARRKALDFANALEAMEPRRPENLQMLAATNGLSVGEAAPFGREEEPKGLDVGPEFAKKAFELTAQDPFGGPIKGTEGAYEIALKDRMASRIPSLEEIRDQVNSDYKYSQAVGQAKQAATAFYQTATNGLANGKGFQSICVTARVKPVELPPFSISTRALPEVEDQISLDQVKFAAFSTPPNHVTSPHPTREGAIILYVREKLPVDAARMNAELPTFTQALRQRRQQETFNQWLGREAEKALRDTPVFQPQQPPPAMGSAAKGKS